MAQLRVSRDQGGSSDVVRRFARFGYAVKGITYLMIGLLAARAALGAGRAGDTRDTFDSLDSGVVGTVLLGVVAAGLGAYALYKLYFAHANPEHSKAPKRISALFISLVNGGLAFAAARL